MSNYFTADNDAWLLQRRGKITSSEVWKLFKGGRKKDEMFGEGAMTYIRSRVTEMQSGEVKEELDARSLAWGKDNEVDAKSHFEAITGFSVIYHGISCPKFYPYGDFAGGSPDGEIIEPDAVLELKCPYNEDVHTKRLLIKSVQEFKEQENEAWHQLQMNMMIMGKDIGYFGSFDPRRKEEKLKMKIIKLQADIDWQSDFQARLDAALEIMSEILYDTDKYLFVQ